MPVHVNFHIFVDTNGKATVTSQTISGGTAPTLRLQRGDKVTFTSNDPASEIRLKNHNGAAPPRTKVGSPFGAQLPPGKRHKVAAGVAAGTVFTVKVACDFDNHFDIDCGHEVNRHFSDWGARDGHTPGFSLPGPND